MSTYHFDAVIFDLDGVITKTAATHSRAWKKMFDDFLKDWEATSGMLFSAFTSADYLQFVDGKPRYDGVKSFLDSRNIELPFGTPEDGVEMVTVCGLGNRKNEAFNEVLKKEGVEVYPSTVQLLRELKSAGIHIGVASSSKNAEAVLSAAGLADFVETRVDGVVSAEMGLKGKPAPDIFIQAAKNLGVKPHHAVVVEDASSGVAAGRNGNFGLVLGLAREDNTQALQIHGADVVVEDIEFFGFKEIEQWFKRDREEADWKISYHDYYPDKEKSREALLSVGNGYLGTRGAMEETSAGEHNYPGTYMAGLYNRLVSPIAERDIVNEDFVNVPNWLPVSFKIDDEPWFDPNTARITEISRHLDLRNGLLSRKMLIRDDENRQTLIESQRFVSMDNPHLAALKYRITPLNYSASICIYSALDGTLANQGVSRYKSLKSKHLEPISQGGEGPVSYLVCGTSQSKIEIAEAARLRFLVDGSEHDIDYGVTSDEGIVYTYIDYEARENESIQLEKLVSLYASHQHHADDVKSAALSELRWFDSFDHLLEKNNEAWAKLWREADMVVAGDRASQQLIRLHIYHLLVSGSTHNDLLDASITARGLHGEAYRGHIFWDELFILPFYFIHFPETARSLLMYRYRRLDAARKYAREYGYRGAMFPWQSGSEGREETQVVHLNPLTGNWGPDHSSLQRHVSLAIAYNFWQYFHFTNDRRFMEQYGAEVYLEICRFWASKAEKDPLSGRYSIPQVMGPDEFHEMLPASKEGGLTNNAYTNIMVAWMYSKVPDLLETLSSEAKTTLFDKISLAGNELLHWAEIKSNLRLDISEEGIIAQFDGYFDLEELDWEYFRNKYGNIYRMDRLLLAEGKSADHYKVAKQADTLMVFYNLPKTTVDNLIAGMGYQLPDDYLEKNLSYYLQRTSHGSTLSRVVHAQLGEMIGAHQLSWQLYQEALSSDYVDVQGGTTAEGIHAGVMAGTIMTALFTYGGVDLKGEHLIINPSLPPSWEKLSCKLKFKGSSYQLVIQHDQVKIETQQRRLAVVFGVEYEIGIGLTIITKDTQ